MPTTPTLLVSFPCLAGCTSMALQKKKSVYYRECACWCEVVKLRPSPPNSHPSLSCGPTFFKTLLVWVDRDGAGLRVGKASIGFGARLPTLHSLSVVCQSSFPGLFRFLLIRWAFQPPAGDQPPTPPMLV